MDTGERDEKCHYASGKSVVLLSYYFTLRESDFL